jgi:hypothetical protein
LDVRDQVAVDDRMQHEARVLRGWRDLLLRIKVQPRLDDGARSDEHATPRELAGHREVKVTAGHSPHLLMALDRVGERSPIRRGQSERCESNRAC